MNMYDYEYLVRNLTNYAQVYGNKRRTSKKQLISDINRGQLDVLALKYFGVDANGEYTNDRNEIVSYRCPYSGEIIDDLSRSQLDHILPFASNGGTVLFNCIPVLDKVNCSKSNNNLLNWWMKQDDYFSYDRLERLTEYILEAYRLVYIEENIDNEFSDIDKNVILVNKDNLNINLANGDSKYTKKAKAGKENITYFQLISGMIAELKRDRDTTQLEEKLKELKDRDVFGKTEEVENLINIVQNILKEEFGDDNRLYLAYSMNINMHKLLKSLKTKDYEKEIRERFSNIKTILEDNHLHIVDYFKNIDEENELDESNILYYDINKYTDEQIRTFIDNISIGIDSKIKLFIEMINNKTLNLNNHRKNPFSTCTGGIPFKGYENIKMSAYFWRNNNHKIIKLLFFDENYNIEDYNIARQNVLEYLNSNRRKKKLLEFCTIYEYIDTLDKTKKENKELIDMKNSLISRREELLMENQKMTNTFFEEYNDLGVRRAM